MGAAEPRYWHHCDPAQLVAVCDRGRAERLIQFDHHQVIVRGCWGVLITYPWMPLEEATEPLVAIVIFNPAPRHAPTEDAVRMIVRKHPLAPPDIQAIIDRLDFRSPDS